MRNSDYHLVGIAEVTKDYNYLEDGGEITCYLKEKVPEHLGGHLKPDVFKSTGQNAITGSVSSYALKQNTIRAKWIADGYNRLTCPNVCIGETVRIYQIGRSGMYFWDTAFNSFDMRKHERVVYAWSNRPIGLPPGANKIYKTQELSAYQFKIDTYDKQVHFNTVHNDGELTPWDIQLDTKEGIFTIISGLTDEFQIDSKKNDINLSARNDIDMIADHDKRTAVGNDTFYWNKENITIRNGIFWSPINITGAERTVGICNRQITGQVRASELVGPLVMPKARGNIDIENGINIKLLNHNDIDITNMHDITTLNMHDITLTNMNNITTTNMNNISLTNINNIDVKNMNNIDLKNMNSITIKNMNTIDLKSINSINVKSFRRLDQMTFGHSIVSNMISLYPTLIELCTLCAGDHPPTASAYLAIAAKFGMMQGA